MSILRLLESCATGFSVARAGDEWWAESLGVAPLDLAAAVDDGEAAVLEADFVLDFVAGSAAAGAALTTGAAGFWGDDFFAAGVAVGFVTGFAAGFAAGFGGDDFFAGAAFRVAGFSTAACSTAGLAVFFVVLLAPLADLAGLADAVLPDFLDSDGEADMEARKGV